MEGNSNTLPIFHYLRYFGQSGKCCPQGYYEPDGKYFNKEVFINADKPITAASLTKKNDMDFCVHCDNNLDRYEEIKNFLLDAKGAYIWHHKPGSGFDFQDVSKAVVEAMMLMRKKFLMNKRMVVRKTLMLMKKIMLVRKNLMLLQ